MAAAPTRFAIAIRLTSKSIMMISACEWSCAASGAASPIGRPHVGDGRVHLHATGESSHRDGRTTGGPPLPRVRRAARAVATGPRCGRVRRTRKEVRGSAPAGSARVTRTRSGGYEAPRHAAARWPQACVNVPSRDVSKSAASLTTLRLYSAPPPIGTPDVLRATLDWQSTSTSTPGHLATAAAPPRPGPGRDVHGATRNQPRPAGGAEASRRIP